jgi:hypothetical protein
MKPSIVLLLDGEPFYETPITEWKVERRVRRNYYGREITCYNFIPVTADGCIYGNSNEWALRDEAGKLHHPEVMM